MGRLEDLKAERLKLLKAERDELMAQEAEPTPSQRPLGEQDLEIGNPPPSLTDQPEAPGLALEDFVPEETQANISRLVGDEGVAFRQQLKKDGGGAGAILDTARAPFQIGGQIGETAQEGIEGIEAGIEEDVESLGDIGKRGPLAAMVGATKAFSTVTDLVIPQSEIEVLFDTANPIGFAFNNAVKAGKMTAELSGQFAKAAKDFLFKDKSTAAAKKLFTWARAHGVDLLPGQMKDNPGLLRIESVIDKVEITSAFMREHIAKQVKALSVVGEKIRKKMGSAGFKESGMGEVLQDAIKDTRKQFQKIAKANYDAIPREGGEVVLKEETSALVKRLSELIEQVKTKVPAQRNGKLLASLEQWRARSYRGGNVVMENIKVTDELGKIHKIPVAKKAPKEAAMTWNQVMALRSEIGEAVGDAKAGSTVEGVYKQAFKSLVNDVEPAMIKSGSVPEGLSDAAAHARSFYKSGVGEEGVFNNALVKTISESRNPITLVKTVFKKDNITNLKLLKKFMNGGSLDGIQKADAWDNLTREFTEDILTKRVEGIELVDPSTIVKKMKALGHNDEMLELVYGKEGAEDLINLSDTWQKLTEQSKLFLNASGTSSPLVNFDIIKKSISGPGSARGIGATIMALPGAAATVLSPSGLAYLYTHKEGRKILSDLMTTTVSDPNAGKTIGRAMSYMATRASRDRKRKDNPLEKKVVKGGLKAL